MGKVSMIDIEKFKDVIQGAKNKIESSSLKELIGMLSVLFESNAYPLIELYRLRNLIKDICEDLSLEIETFVFEFNKVFRYRLYDLRSENKVLFTREDIYLKKMNKKMFDKFTNRLNNYNSWMHTEDFANVILRYYLKLEYQEEKELEQLTNFDSNRLLSIFDFNSVCIRHLQKDSLKEILLKNYINIDPSLIGSELIKKIERQDKFYFIDHADIEFYYNNKHNSILKDEKEFDLIKELLNSKKEINQSNYSTQVDSYIQVIIDELKLIQILIKFNLLVISKNYMKAKKFLLNKQHIFSSIQKCLLVQIFTGVLDINIDGRFSEQFNTIAKELINKFGTINCDPYIGKKEACLHSTFHYYTYHKWMLSVNKILYNLGFIPSNRIYLTPNEKLKMNNEVIDPMDAFCNKCYNEYNNLKKEIFEYNQNDSLYIKYILFEHKNKMPLYRIRFSDQCEIPSLISSINPTLNHYSQFMESKTSAAEILRKILYSISQEINNIYKQKYGFYPF